MLSAMPGKEHRRCRWNIWWYKIRLHRVFSSRRKNVEFQSINIQVKSDETTVCPYRIPDYIYVAERLEYLNSSWGLPAPYIGLTSQAAATHHISGSIQRK
jgi:hypothetical protein